MKKLLSCALIFIMLLTAASATFAAGMEYEVTDFDFKLRMPEDWTTFTRDIEEGDPGLKELGLDKDSLLKQYEDYYIYLNSIRMEPLSEIVVTVIEHKDYEDIHNMSLLSLKQINELGESMTRRGSGGAEYHDYSTYAKDGMTFLVLDFNQTTEGRTVYSKQYSTVVNGNLISIVMRDYEDEISPDDERLLKETADSLYFGHIDEKNSASGFLNKFSSFKTVGYSMLIAGAVIFILVILINSGGTKIKKIK